MAMFLIRMGLIVLALSMGVLLAGVAGWIQHERLGEVARLGLAVGAGCLVVGFLLGFLTKTGGLLTVRRCARCRRRVRKGQIYCPDHLSDALREARDKYHDERGSGI